MKPYLSIKKLKGLSREQLLGKYGAVIFAVLIFFIIRNTTILITTFPMGNTLLSTILFHAISFVMDVFFGIFQFGLAKLFLNIASGRPFSGLDLFSGLLKTPDRIIQISLPLALISLVCYLPYFILSFCIQFNFVPTLPYKTPVLLLIYAMCSAIHYIVCLNFAPVYYLLADLPEIPPRKIMQMSIWLMRKSRLRFFLLQLSFLPIQFVGLLSCCIGFLWITPYVNTTYARFYLDLSEKRNQA